MDLKTIQTNRSVSKGECVPSLISHGLHPSPYHRQLQYYLQADIQVIKLHIFRINVLFLGTDNIIFYINIDQ